MRTSLVVFSWLASTLVFGNRALAQTWSLTREAPSLFEIVSVDASGDAQWPYGQEDLAADGVTTENADEAAVDLRSVYADARAARLWLRAYAVAKAAATSTAVAFFFIDSDANKNTGGDAAGAQLWPAFGTDPSPGGYERAVGLRGDGTLIGVFYWDAQKKQWAKQPDSPPLTAAEVGVARDPLRILGDEHAYFQVSLDLSTAGLDEACTGTIFVRLWNDANGKRSFGDDADMNEGLCRAKLNVFGDPALLRSDVCSVDSSCPAQGHCRDGVCLFGYACSADAECRAGERCSAGVCTRVVDKACTQSTDCDGLVCDAGRCVACGSGARACATGALCSPDGRCLRGATGGAAGSGSGAHSGSAAAGSAGDRVRGGAFTCSALRLRSGAYAHWTWALMALGLWRRGRKARRGHGAGVS